MAKTKEGVIQDQVWKFLESINAYPCKIENQATMDPMGFRRNFSGGTKRKGLPDLFFFIGGHTVFCELKTPENYGYIQRNWDKLRSFVPAPKVKGQKKKYDRREQYQNQIIFIEEVRSRGQIAFFADSIQVICKELSDLFHKGVLNLSKSELEAIKTYEKITQ